MEFYIKHLLRFFMFFFCFSLSAEIQIKVLLDEYDTNKDYSFKLSANDRSFSEVVVKKNILYARKNSGPLRKLKRNAFCLQSDKPISINGQPYEGDIFFRLNKSEKKLSLVNKVDLENYVFAVIQAEGFSKWPTNMHKLQAIISRTYAIRQMREQRKKKNRPFYDIKGNNYHQKYNGNLGYNHLREAVTSTKGIILTYQDEAVLTMFDACCGGSTPANISGLDFNKAPYLRREEPCHFCKEHKLYQWERKMPVSKFFKSLYAYKPIASKLSKDCSLNDIFVAQKDNGGTVKTIALVQSPKKKVFISSKDLSKSLNAFIPSKSYSIRKQNNNIIFLGNGYGHRTGFCQEGGCYLVKLGWSIKKILSFYYPHTKLARLKTFQNVW